MKTAHATAHGMMAFPGIGSHRKSGAHDALMLAERAVGASVLLACEAVLLWVLLSSIYFAAWPVH